MSRALVAHPASSDFHHVRAANAAKVFPVFLYAYEPAFDQLRQMNLVLVEHRTRLPLCIFPGICCARLITRLNSSRIYIFAYYLPGFDPSQLTRDIEPINTLPIVFNHYFSADFPLK